MNAVCAGNIEIITLYEQGASIEEIAAELCLDISAIKVTLIQGSQKYRDMLREKEIKNADIVSDGEMKELVNAYKNVALYSEIDSVKERALRFLINERKGRNDIGILQKSNVNVNIFNQHINMARERVAKALKSASVINIENEVSRTA